MAGRFAAVQNAHVGQYGGGGADGAQPAAPIAGLLDQRGGKEVHLDGGHAPQAAGEDQHLSVGQVHLGQLQIGTQGDPVGTGDGGTGEGDQGGLQTGLPEQVGGDDGFRLLEAGGEQDINHNETSLKSVNGWDPGRSGTGPGRGSQKGLCQGPDLLVDGLDGAQPARLVHTADHLPA